MNLHQKAVKKLLESEGDDPQTIESILELIKISDDEKKSDNFRSWISVVISIVAVAVSFLALFINLK